MTLKLEQKYTEIDKKNIAYVEATLLIDQYTYRVLFDKNTKKRFNAYCKNLGFVVGVVDNGEKIVKEVTVDGDVDILPF